MSATINSTPAPYICGGCHQAQDSAAVHIPDTVSQLFRRCLPYGPASYETLLQLLRNSKSKVDFWGIYRVSIDGHKNPVTYASIRNMFYDLIEKNREFSEREREFGKNCVTEFARLRNEEDNLFKKASCITKFIRGLIDCFTGNYSGQNTGRRASIQCSTTEIFNRYTTNQFITAFNVHPKRHFGEYCAMYRYRFGPTYHWEHASHTGQNNERLPYMSEERRNYIRRESDRIS